MKCLAILARNRRAKSAGGTLEAGRHDCPGVLGRVREELRNTEERCRENAEVER